MAEWRHRIMLKDLFSEDSSPDAVGITARETHTRLETFAKTTFPLNRELEDIIDQFHTIGYVDERPSCDEFNLILNELYDFADEMKVWVD